MAQSKVLILIIALGSTVIFGFTTERNFFGLKKRNADYGIIDSIQSLCNLNTTSLFAMEELQTDDFTKMKEIDLKLFNILFPERKDFMEMNFFILSYLENSKNYLSLVIYEKNYEAENYRVDKVKLVIINSSGRKLNEIILATKDNEVITYEVSSSLHKDSLTTIEKQSTEMYYNPKRDTLFISTHNIKLNGMKSIDTLSNTKDFQVRFF